MSFVLAALLAVWLDRAIVFGIRWLRARLETKRRSDSPGMNREALRLVSSGGRPVIRRATVGRYPVVSDDYFPGPSDDWDDKKY